MTPKHVLWSVEGSVATVTLNRPEKKNPLTFESYAELRDTFHVDEAITAEAQAQALCMATKDFRRAYEAFAAKQTPVFEGN